MKHLLISLLVLSSGSVAFAQQAKVIKVKGNQAIVQFPTGIKPQQGQLLTIGGEDSSGDFESDGGGTGGGGSASGGRSHVIGGSASLSYTSNSATSKYTTGVSFLGRYGWNMGQFEAGPTGALTYSSTEGLSTRVLEVGGFGDFNLVPNKPGVEMVYGLGADAGIGQTVTTTNATESSNTTMRVFAGGFMKWFGLKTSTAVRVDAGLNYERLAATSTTTNFTGFVVRLGLYNYF